MSHFRTDSCHFENHYDVRATRHTNIVNTHIQSQFERIVSDIFKRLAKPLKLIRLLKLDEISKVFESDLEMVGNFRLLKNSLSQNFKKLNIRFHKILAKSTEITGIIQFKLKSYSDRNVIELSRGKRRSTGMNKSGSVLLSISRG
jgi:hypothetical protein